MQRGIAGIVDIFMQPYREQCFGGCLYRPLTLTTFAIEWALAPKSPFIGHLLNVLWYSATAILLYLTLRRFVPKYNILLPIVAVLLFIAHPIHTEVVANIKSRDEILSLFFVILSLHRYSKWHQTHNWKTLLAAGLAFFAGLFSKESAITAIFLFPLVGWTFYQKSLGDSFKNSSWALVPVALFFLVRSFALSGLTEPPIIVIDNPIVDAQGTEHIGTVLFVLAKYLFQLTLPIRLLSDYSYNVIPLQSFGSIGSLAGLLFYGAIAAYALYALAKRRITGFIAAAFLSSIALYIQIPKVIGVLMAERLLYAPSLWFVLGLTAFLNMLFKAGDGASTQFKWKQLIPAQRNLLFACIGITILYSFQVLIRNDDWKSNFKLYEADVAKAPNSVRLNDGYAEELYKTTFDPNLSEKEIDERLIISEQYSRKSLSIKPGISAYNNLGNISFTRKNFADAISYYQKNLEILKDYDAAKRNIAYAFMVWANIEMEKHNNPEHARELLQQALQYQENNGDIWHMIGISYSRQGNHAEAVKAFEKAYSLAPTNTRIKSDLANTYLNLGMGDKAAGLK